VKRATSDADALDRRDGREPTVMLKLLLLLLLSRLAAVVVVKAVTTRLFLRAS